MNKDSTKKIKKDKYFAGKIDVYNVYSLLDGLVRCRG